MLGFIKQAGRVLGNPVGAAADFVGGLIPGDQSAGAIGRGVASGASSAWDVLSGERDYRRQIANRDLSWAREDDYYSRVMKGLSEAGINPMMAGQLGSMPSSPSTAQSHSAESVGRLASLAGSIASGGAGVAKTLTELGAIKANTAHTVAQTASEVQRLPVGIAKEVAQTALLEAQVPQAQASTAHSVQQTKESAARTEQTGVRTSQMRHEMPRFHAEADYYRQYGKSAYVAKNSPLGLGVLVGDQLPQLPKGGGLFDLRRRANAAADRYVSQAMNSAMSVMNNLESRRKTNLRNRQRR